MLLLACGDAGAGSDSADVDPTAGPGPTSGTAMDLDTGEEPEPTGGPFPGCDGVLLAQDGALDLDIPVVDYVVVSGVVRVRGEPLPAVDGPRGTLVFEAVAGDRPPVSFSQALASVGDDSYSIVLPAGSFAVHYVPDAALCAADRDGPMPCTGGTLVAAVDLFESGALDLDIPSMTVTGAVTQNGAALPDDAGERGHLEFTRVDGAAAATKGFGDAGPATYAIALFPGAYDISYVGEPGLCSDGAAHVPCNRGVVQRDVALQASGALDLDVKKVDISGAVTVNGAAIADAGGDRGALRLRPAGVEAGGELLAPSFGAAGPVSYALSLVAGTYDIELVVDPAQCDGDPPVTPCGGGVVVASAPFLQSGALDIDVPMIEVAGKVTLRGAALPDAPGARGSLLFTRDGGQAASIALGATDPVDYLLALMPGSYTIAYATDGALCDGVTAPAMPCTGGPLQAIVLASSGALDVDIPAVEVAGAVALNGGVLPSQPTGRGSLRFAAGDAAGVSVALGSEGAADYALTVLPGTYDVAYVAAGPCTGLPDDAMPCGGGGLLAGVALTTDGALDVDIPAITIAGAVRHGGMPLPDLPDARGQLLWSRVAGDGALTLDLGAGDGQYDVRLMPGRWIVDHDAVLDLCADGLPTFPCTDQVLLGCPER